MSAIALRAVRQQPGNRLAVGIVDALQQQRIANCGLGRRQIEQCLRLHEIAGAERVSQQLGRRAFVALLRHRVDLDAGGQILSGLQHRYQTPAPGAHGMLDRAFAVLIALLAIDANRQQQAEHFRRIVRRQACQRQRIAALRVAHQDIQPGLLGQLLQHRDISVAGGVQQRRHAGRITRIAIGAGSQQGLDDLRIAGLARQHQCAALLCIAGIDFCLVPQQQANPRRIVVAGTGSKQRRLTRHRCRRRATFQQQPRDPPVRNRAGHRQRAQTVLVHGVQRGAGIQQRGDHTRIAGSRRMMQRRVAIAIGESGVGAIGEQHADRVEPPLPTVACCRQQRAEPGMGVIDVDAAFEQGAQDAKIRQQRGKHRQRALIARVIARQRMHIGARSNRHQGLFAVAVAYCRIERLRIGRCAQLDLVRFVRSRLLRCGSQHRLDARRPLHRDRVACARWFTRCPARQRQQHLNRTRQRNVAEQQRRAQALIEQRLWPGEQQAHHHHRQQGNGGNQAECVAGIGAIVIVAAGSDECAQATAGLRRTGEARPGIPQRQQQQPGNRTQHQQRLDARIGDKHLQRPGDGNDRGEIGQGIQQGNSQQVAAAPGPAFALRPPRHQAACRQCQRCLRQPQAQQRCGVRHDHGQQSERSTQNERRQRNLRIGRVALLIHASASAQRQ